MNPSIFDRPGGSAAHHGWEHTLEYQISMLSLILQELKPDHPLLPLFLTLNQSNHEKARIELIKIWSKYEGDESFDRNNIAHGHKLGLHFCTELEKAVHECRNGSQLNTSPSTEQVPSCPV